MRIVLLGGTGFIGSHLARTLIARGDTVVIPSRSSGKPLPKWAASQRGTFIAEVWDGRDSQQLAHIIDGADGVVNLLGENIAARRWTPEQKHRIRDSRLLAGRALTAAFAQVHTRPAVVIQASAVGWYGTWSDIKTAPVCVEDNPPGCDFLAETTVLWEDSTAPLEREFHDVRRCVIRTAPVLGRDGGMLQPILPLFKYGLGGPTGSGQQPFAWIHLDDEVAAIVFLLDTPSLSGPFNLAAPHPVSNYEFAHTLGKLLHRPVWLPAPAFALRLALGEMADALLLKGQKVIPQRLQEAGFHFTYPELNAALASILN